MTMGLGFLTLEADLYMSPLVAGSLVRQSAA